MNIAFKGKHKSIREFEWIDVPKLAVVTGLNGSGKSQLLELVHSAYSHVSSDKNSNGVYKSTEFEMRLEGISFQRQSVLNWQSRGGHFQFEHYNFSYSDLEETVNLIMHLINPPANVKSKPEEQESSYEYSQRGFNRVRYLIDQKKDRIITALSERSGKQKSELLEEDILFYLPEDIIFEDYDLINSDSLDMVFYLHMYRRISLEVNNEDASKLGRAPWTILNEVLNSAGLPYSFSHPDEKPIRAIFRNPLNRNSSYKFKIKLFNLQGVEIGLTNLSSGERVILSLAMLLYYFQHRDVRLNLIVLDEIDAHLHPSLTKQFFEVVNENIIKNYGASVLMATHSPSTVALAPESSLFAIEKGEDTTIITSVTKDAAINLLTAGVPSLSINYENRRQIFVESKYDAEYYDTLYQILRTMLPNGVSLNFISSGVSGRGNCDQVISIVKELNGFGNKSIFGIIDWDKKNSSTRNVRVLGEGKRYSIESYIFDPALMGFLLWREKILTTEDFGLDSSYTYLDFKSLTSDKVQQITDVVLARIKSKFDDINDNTIFVAKYQNGLSINLPNWYLLNYGHDLPDFYLDTFPQLRRFHGENGLRKAVINNTIPDIPGFVPADLVDFMKYFHEIRIHDDTPVQVDV
ncbi:MAG: ATP-binding protein [Cyclobacteriaceae bacterium]|nr:ATP-binding protein [Cyclobacteriaceae bacterium]